MSEITSSSIACTTYQKKNRRGDPRRCFVSGGAEGDRTPDLMTASHALSHLSYGPVSEQHSLPQNLLHNNKREC